MNELVATRIKEIRTENNLTQAQMGKILSLSQDNVSLWENGKSLPTAENVIKICKTFHVSADYLLGLTEY